MKDHQGWLHQGIEMRDCVRERERKREGKIERDGERVCGCV